MTYQDREKNEYDLNTLSPKGKEHMQWLCKEYTTCTTWTEFDTRTSGRIVRLAKKEMRNQWQEHPLYNIQLDMLANIGIQEKELREELSNMIAQHD
jgi:hypothetical protein